jgi:hypothetical protein
MRLGQADAIRVGHGGTPSGNELTSPTSRAIPVIGPSALTVHEGTWDARDGNPVLINPVNPADRLRVGQGSRCAATTPL